VKGETAALSSIRVHLNTSQVPSLHEDSLWEDTYMDVLADALHSAICDAIEDEMEYLHEQMSAPSPGLAAGPGPVPTILASPISQVQTRHLRSQMPDVSEHLPDVSDMLGHSASHGIETFSLPAPAPGPAPMPGPSPDGMPKVDVHVQFLPGSSVYDENHLEIGRTTKVQAFIFGEPATFLDELPLIKSAVDETIANGQLQEAMKKSLEQATGLIPFINKVDASMDHVTQWSLSECENHMTRLVRRLSTYYTRRMVPTAIYNECSNFLVKSTFSHDRILTTMDKNKCRLATVKFSKGWNFGKAPKVMAPPVFNVAGPAGAMPAKSPPAFKDFCYDVCEIKFGTAAPLCDITHGEKIAHQPN
jgi:hypothetical protein